jgi:Sec-independent protein secretion pathway component TatC
VVSQIMLAIPICLLYEAGVFIASAISKPEPDAEPDAAAMPADPGKPADG